MKKHELINAVAFETGAAARIVRDVLNATCEVVCNALARGDSVHLIGLGKIRPVSKGERVARNIHTGESVIVPPRKGVHFSPSTGLNRSVNAQ